MLCSAKQQSNYRVDLEEEVTEPKIWMKTKQCSTRFLATSHSSLITAFFANHSRGSLLIFYSSNIPIVSPQRRRRPIHHKPRGNQQQPERQAADPQNLLALAVHD